VINGISFHVEAGERVALVGSSGSGKSTLTALLLRFYDPDSGSILLDGDNIKTMCPDELRGMCSLVSQEPILFDGTISDNIRYGRLDATQQEINAAARKVGAWQFISALPEGMQTRVGDRGLQLSGGQKQRVAIARAVIRKPTVMLFDEATSALDSIHEEEVQNAIDLASEGLTTITIAHRMTAVRNCDRVIVLEEGRIVEEGPPDELMGKEGGRFQKLYNDQRVDISAHAPTKSNLVPHASVALGQYYRPQITGRRATLTRSTSIEPKKIGKSYSVLSHDREKLALPVMSKKRSQRLDYKYSTVGRMDLDIDVTPAEEEPHLDLPGKSKSYHAVWELISGYKDGYALLGGAIPTTIIRAFFYLLICFEVASVLEVSIVPQEERAERIFIVAAVYIALIIIKTIFEALGRLFIALFGHGFCSYMRLTMFRKVMRHGCAYFDEERNSPGRILTKIINDSSSLNKIMEQKLDLLIPAIICPAFSFIAAMYINWKMALLCSFQFPAYFIIRIVQIKEGTKRQREMVNEENNAANLATIVLSNMSTIKAYNLQEHFYSIFTKTLEPLARAMKRQSMISSFVFACQFSFTYILIAITLYFGKVMMLSNQISVFDYMRVVLLTQFGANFFSQLVASVSDLSKARIAAENVVNVLKETPNEIDNLTEEGQRPKLEGNIQLHNVSFRYPTRPVVPILNKLNLKIKTGQNVALVGPSGSGKSSIIALIQRMYNATDGEVLLDKYNVQSINPAYLRRVVVSVGQEPTLFSFTIKENIIYGMMENEVSMEQVIEAAKIANIHDFISRLPQGYDTEIGEFGAQLSGGQKQRIAIARAIVRKPVILLLDEATAALDSASEKAVQMAFEKAQKSCTCIQIAHRLSTIRNVDKIFVVVDGAIAEEGTHEQLLNKHGTSLIYQLDRFFVAVLHPAVHLSTKMLKNVIEQLVNSPNNEHKPLTNFINNEFVETDDLIASVNPATGRTWIQIPNSGEKEVNEAVAAANQAFPSWSTTSVQHRSNLLLKLADIIEENAEGFATLESRDQGKPVTLARAIDIPRCIHNFRFFATAILHHISPSTVIDEPVRAVNYVRNDPIGVAGLISPWNLPLYLLSFKLAPALATGNTVVCKPSELTSVTAWVLMHAFKEAGFPPGVVNMIIGTGPSAGQHLVEHPDVPLVSFTGSTLVGKKIAEVGARLNKKVSLEMGGKNAAIVYPSCDLEKNLSTIAKSCFINQGEICLCSSRIFVHSSVYDTFVKGLVNEAKKYTIGDPTTNVTLGAINSKAHFDKVKSYIAYAEEDGGTVHCGGTIDFDGELKNGYFIAPTVVSGLEDTSRCMQEEIFGPVVCVTKFGSLEEVTNRANDTCYGLSATVWSENSEELLNTAHALRVGTVWCNTWLTRDLNMPFGGTKQSGMGREGALDSLHFFTEQKTICIKM
ncbi:unnamed protein product, partial [Cylicocyclus nassatus]